MPSRSALRVAMFGPLHLDVGGRPLGPRDLGGRRPKQVLEALLVHRGEAVPKDHLIDLVWGERLPVDPVRTLEASVSVVRSHLDPTSDRSRSVVRSDPGAYRISLDDVDVDLDRFDELSARGAQDRRGARHERWADALDLVRGPVLADEPYAEWVLPLRELYAERHLDLLLDAGEDLVEAGEPGRALELAESVLRSQPWRERAHRLVIGARYLLGEQDEALRAYDRCRAVLAEELGVSPLPDTEHVYLAILNQEPAAELIRILQPDRPVRIASTGARPVTQFARGAGGAVAYQVFGEGPLDLVLALGWFSHVEVGWEEPRFAAFMERLATKRRVLLFDRRGSGMSDPVPPATPFDARADDILTVMDAAGSDRAVVLGVSEGGPMGISVAARAPGRIAGLVLYSCFGRLMATPEYPWGWSPEFLELYHAGLDAAWTSGHGVEIALPSVTGDEDLREWVCRCLRLSVSPAEAHATLDLAAQTDVRHHLPAVRCPTLVLHRRDERWVSPGNGRYVASSIAGARFVELPGIDYWPWLGDAGSVLDPVETWLENVAGTLEDPEGFPRVEAG